jgi:hypothetical protein
MRMIVPPDVSAKDLPSSYATGWRNTLTSVPRQLYDIENERDDGPG